MASIINIVQYTYSTYLEQKQCLDVRGCERSSQEPHLHCLRVRNSRVAVHDLIYIYWCTARAERWRSALGISAVPPALWDEESRWDISNYRHTNQMARNNKQYIYMFYQFTGFHSNSWDCIIASALGDGDGGFYSVVIMLRVALIRLCMTVSIGHIYS